MSERGSQGCNEHFSVPHDKLIWILLIMVKALVAFIVCVLVCTSLCDFRRAMNCRNGINRRTGQPCSVRELYVSVAIMLLTAAYLSYKSFVAHRMN